MPVRDVLRYPEPLLKQVAAPAQPAEVERVATDLIDTMRAFPGCVGIAAPQIGELVRVAVIDLTGHRHVANPSGLVVLANPRVISSSGSEVAREGCLSIPDLTANVSRATEITVAHAAGTLSTSGFEARCVLHEIDHLDGILFLDRVESISDDLFRRRTKK